MVTLKTANHIASAMEIDHGQCRHNRNWPIDPDRYLLFAHRDQSVLAANISSGAAAKELVIAVIEAA